MKKIDTYKQIQQHKQEGFSKYRTAQIMGISQMTVTKYWDMSLDEFNAIITSAQTRTKLADQYRAEIIQILRKYPEMGSDNIARVICLMRGIDSLNVKGHAFHNYVQDVRKEYCLVKPRTAATKSSPDQEKKSIHDRLRENKAISKELQREKSPLPKKKNRDLSVE